MREVREQRPPRHGQAGHDESRAPHADGRVANVDAPCGEDRVVEQHGCADGDHEREQAPQLCELWDRVREEVDDLQCRERQERDDSEVIHGPPPVVVYVMRSAPRETQTPGGSKRLQNVSRILPQAFCVISSSSSTLISTTLALEPSDGPTTPRRSRRSMSRPARAKPTRSLRCSMLVEPMPARTTRSIASPSRSSPSSSIAPPPPGPASSPCNPST